MLPETFWQDFFTRTHTKLATQTKPVPHIKTVLGSLKLPYCTASNGSLDKMHTTLGACGLLEYFSGKMFSAEQVAAGKPAPDVFLLAAPQMGAPPQHCAVVEDSPVGVRAATAAGMSVFGYAALTPADALLQAGATQTFDDMRRLPELLGCPAADSAA